MKKYIIAFATLVYSGLSAQNIHTAYHSQAFVLQSTANTAAIPESNVVLGFPGLSNLNYGLQWPLSLNEIFQKGQDDSLRISFPSIVSNLDNKDVLSLDVRHQILHLGFKLGEKKNIFAYLGNEIVTDFGFHISGDLLDYLTRGNAQFLNRQMNFDQERLDVSVYHSFYVGAAVDVNEKWNVGARLKALTGLVNVHTENVYLGFYTDSTSMPVYQTTLQADMLVQTSGMGLIDDSLDFNPISNSGLAFDVGAIYKPTEQLEFSFALNDIGSIDWAEENNEYHTTDGQVEYAIEGLTKSSSGSEDFEDQIQEITDSLSATMELITSSGAYTTKLKSNLFLGAKYQLNEKHSFSFLFHSKEHAEDRTNVYGAGYQLQVAKSLQLLASYYNYDGIANVGTGFVWSPGPLQFHLILDNTLIADVFDAKNLSLQMGLSFHFGKE